MTKSQNTKNEQQKDLCITSEQLTEQWKKGELPCGWYYIKIADIVFIDFFEGKVWKNKKDEYIDEVLAEVPSYEEWEQLQNWARFTDDYHELREKLEIAEYVKAELKELLKECREEIGDEIDDCTDPRIELFGKINEVLK